MVSFNCQRCDDVVTKPKVMSHASQCGSKAFTCVDCYTTFDLSSVKAHQQCITEVKKFQDKWQDKKHLVKGSAETSTRRSKFTAADFSDDSETERPAKSTRTEKSASVKSPAAAPKKPAPVLNTAPVQVAEFSLGPSHEVLDMCASVIDVSGQSSVDLASIARSLAHEVYAKRIEKQVLAAVRATLEANQGGRVALSPDGKHVSLSN
jgi:hypothetical protein